MKLDCHIITPQLKKAASTLLLLAAGASLAGHLLAQIQPISDNEDSTEQAEMADLPRAAVTEPAAEELDTDGLNNIRDYQAQVDQLESQYGAYHAGLSEVVHGLGLAYQQEGNHDEAILHLNRALQINRVNQGLYHVGKIPLIEQLIASYSATGDWEAVEDRYFTLMQLYSRNYDNTDIELLPGLAKLVKWHLYAYSARVAEQPVSHLLLARELIYQFIGIININYGADDLRQLNPFAALVLTEYYLAVEGAQFTEAPPRAGVNSFREESVTGYFEIPAPYQTVFSRGKLHLEEMIRITQTNAVTPPRTALDVLVMLADWNLLFKKSTTADEIYREVWEQAMTLENPEHHIEEIFGQLTNLPNFSISGISFSENDNDSASQDLALSTTELGVIVIQFDITTSGRATDPELVEADPGASKNTVFKARKQLKSSRFRPRYENGIAVTTQNARIRYRFEPDPEQSLAEASDGE
jgi:tetratricopeptide (TPR) repeat protein